MSTTSPSNKTDPSTEDQSRAASRWRGLFLRSVIVLVLVIVAAAGTVYAVTESRMSKTYEVEPVPLDVEPTAAMVDRGKRLATFRGCRDCHGPNLVGRLVADGMPVMRLAGPNITPGGVTKNYSDKDWARSIRHGVRPDKTPIRFMPSYEWTELSHQDLAAIIAYAKAVPATDEPATPFEVGPLGRVLYLAGELPLLPAETIDHTAKPADPVPGATVEYGGYLSTGCTGCHGEHFSGGSIPGVPPDWPAAPNLTAHASGLEKWTFEDFKVALRKGKRPDGTEIREEYMPWRYIGESSDQDLEALWKYARSLEPLATGNR
jgi:mono/diheme cytochrome c family protein